MPLIPQPVKKRPRLSPAALIFGIIFLSVIGWAIYSSLVRPEPSDTNYFVGHNVCVWEESIIDGASCHRGYTQPFDSNASPAMRDLPAVLVLVPLFGSLIYIRRPRWRGILAMMGYTSLAALILICGYFSLQFGNPLASCPASDTLLHTVRDCTTGPLTAYTIWSWIILLSATSSAVYIPLDLLVVGLIGISFWLWRNREKNFFSRISFSSTNSTLKLKLPSKSVMKISLTGIVLTVLAVYLLLGIGSIVWHHGLYWYIPVDSATYGWAWNLGQAWQGDSRMDIYMPLDLLLVLLLYYLLLKKMSKTLSAIRGKITWKKIVGNLILLLIAGGLLWHAIASFEATL